MRMRCVPTLLVLATVFVGVSLAAAAEDIAPEVQKVTKKLSRDYEHNVRAAAAEMLGYIGDESALSDLAENVQAYPQTIRVGVVESLGRLGGPRAIRVLTETLTNRYLLQEWNEDALRTLSEAFGRIGDKETLPLVRKFYEKGCKYSEGKPEPEMLWGLAVFGDEKAIETIVNWMKTGDPARRKLAADRLGFVGNRKSEEELCMILDYSEDQALRQVAARSLGRRRSKVALDSLLDALRGATTAEAAHALGMLGNPEAVGDLKPLLASSDQSVALEAAFALARLGDKSGLEVVRKRLDDKDVLIQAKAAAALVAVGDEAGTAALKKAWDQMDAKQRHWFIRDNLAGDKWALPFLKDLAANDKYPGIRKLATEL